MKVCKHCHKEKNISDYRKVKKFPDGIDTWCRICRKEADKKTYNKHIVVHRKDGAERKRKQRLKARIYIYEYLKVHPCIDCGETDPVVLEFDHFENKLGDIAVLSQDASLKRIQKEIDKCEVRCANCHRRKTAKERDYFRLICGGTGRHNPE